MAEDLFSPFTPAGVADLWEWDVPPLALPESLGAGVAVKGEDVPGVVVDPCVCCEGADVNVDAEVAGMLEVAEGVAEGRKERLREEIKRADVGVKGNRNAMSSRREAKVSREKKKAYADALVDVIRGLTKDRALLRRRLACPCSKTSAAPLRAAPVALAYAEDHGVLLEKEEEVVVEGAAADRDARRGATPLQPHRHHAD